MTSCPVCPGPKCFLRMWDFSMINLGQFWTTWMIITQKSLPCSRGFRRLQFLCLLQFKYRVSPGPTNVRWSRSGMTLRPESAATLHPRGSLSGAIMTDVWQLLWVTASAALDVVTTLEWGINPQLGQERPNPAQDPRPHSQRPPKRPLLGEPRLCTPLPDSRRPLTYSPEKAGQRRSPPGAARWLRSRLSLTVQL